MAKKILLIDDDAGILDSVSLLLAEYGYLVETSQHGDVIDKMSAILPDLILLDVWISGWNGKDVCKKLKSCEKTHQIPVLLMSAHRDIKETAEESGANGYIAKPFDIDVLLEKVQSQLSLSG
jgi:DNA-binding response OmpR family regulator